jgi:hypothetical protein
MIIWSIAAAANRRFSVKYLEVISVFRGIWGLTAGFITTPTGDTGKTVRITARPATIPRDMNVLLATLASSIS